jgi:hypothetical protein
MLLRRGVLYLGRAAEKAVEVVGAPAQKTVVLVVLPVVVEVEADFCPAA